ncbi:MAG: hypothetical protein IPL88_11080 [Rhizobiales bacterium]|nr:hypothetical protein [Hyphomicrobiales bacterium]
MFVIAGANGRDEPRLRRAAAVAYQPNASARVGYIPVEDIVNVAETIGYNGVPYFETAITSCVLQSESTLSELAAVLADENYREAAAHQVVRAVRSATEADIDAPASSPLWPNDIELMRRLPGFPGGTLDLVASAWSRAKQQLGSARDENWWVWTDLYDAWIEGREQFPGLSEAVRAELDMAICEIPNEDWEKGAAHVNAIIAEMIAKAHGCVPIEDASLPTQVAAAGTFGPNELGKIDHVPATEADRLASTPDIIFFYAEARSLCGELRQLGMQFLGEPTFASADRMERALPSAMSAAVEREIWAAGNALRRKLSAHDAVCTSRDPHPDRLEAGAVERLRAFVEAFNQLAFADPKLRARDERRPGPQEARDARAEIRIIAPVAIQAASDEAITTPDVAAELKSVADEAMATDENVTGRLGAEYARDTHRNFQAAILIAVYRAVRVVRRLATGGGGFVTKEMFKGAYAAIGSGAVTVAGLAVTGNTSWLVTWETVQLVLGNLQTLRVYAPLAFESSPSVKPLLEWLEANVEIEDRRNARERD